MNARIIMNNISKYIRYIGIASVGLSFLSSIRSAEQPTEQPIFCSERLDFSGSSEENLFSSEDGYYSGDEPLGKYLVDSTLREPSNTFELINRLPMVDEGRIMEAIESDIKAGLDINRIDSTGETLLHRACFMNTPRVVSLLIENKADVNIYSSFRGETPIEVVFRNVEGATQCMNLENCELIIQAIVGSQGFTQLDRHKENRLKRVKEIIETSRNKCNLGSF
jgi:hypothetical protein